MRRREQATARWFGWWDVAALALLAALPALFLKLPNGGSPPYGGDLVVHVYPVLSMLARGLHSGRPTLWNFYAAGGYPLAPFSSFALYPPMTVALLLLPTMTAIAAIYAFFLSVLGIGAYVLARDLQQSCPAALLVGITLACGGYGAAHIYAGHLFALGAVCPLPLAFLALRRAIRRRGLVTLLWCGALLGLMVLGAGPQFLPFALIPLPGLAVWHTLARLRAGTGLREVVWPLVALAGAGIVGAVLGAAYLLPFGEVLGATLRGQSISVAAAGAQSLPWGGLAMLAAPNAFGNAAAGTYWPASRVSPYFHEIYAYAGVLPLLLAPAALYRRAAWPYALLALLALLVMLGPNTPLYPLLYHLPGGDLLRAPARAGLTLDFALALLAGFGLDVLLDLSAPARWPDALRRLAPGLLLAALAIAALVATGALAGRAGLPDAARPLALGAALRLLVAAALALAACLAVARYPRVRALALLVPALAFLDLYTANGVLLRPVDPRVYYAASDALKTLPAPSMAYRILAQDGAVPLGLGEVTRRIYDTQDAAPLALRDYWALCHPSLLQRTGGKVIATSRDTQCDVDPFFLRLFGVRVVFSATSLHAPDLRPAGILRSPRWSMPGGANWNVYRYEATSHIYQVDQPLPRAFTVGRAIQAPDAATALAWLQGGRIDPLRTVVLSGQSDQPGGLLGVIQDAWAAWLAADPDNTMKMMVNGGAGGGYLVVDDGWFPGWTATVDGRQVPVRRADHLLRAVRLPPGRHTVRFVYAPLTFLWGAAVTLATACLIIGVTVAALLTRRRSISPTMSELSETAGAVP